MKKFFLYLLLVLIVLGAIFAYILYKEGAFETRADVVKTDAKSFMKCQSGKCQVGKCGSK